MMERASGFYFRSGLFSGFTLMALTGGGLCAIGYTQAGLIVLAVAAALIALTAIETWLFDRRNPPLKVP